MHSVKWAYAHISFGTTISINTCSKSTANKCLIIYSSVFLIL